MTPWLKSLGYFLNSASSDNNEASNAAKFRMNAKYSSPSADAKDGREWLFAFDRDGKLNEAPFPSGCNQAELQKVSNSAKYCAKGCR